MSEARQPTYEVWYERMREAPCPMPLLAIIRGLWVGGLDTCEIARALRFGGKPWITEAYIYKHLTAAREVSLFQTQEGSVG